VKIKEKHNRFLILAVRNNDIQIAIASWFENSEIVSYKIVFDEHNRITKDLILDNDDNYTPTTIEFLL
jgi:hypothetical protein